MPQQPHEAEADYFARLEVEKKCKIAEQKRSEMAKQELTTLQKAHHMRCSHCGLELETIVFKGMSVHKCFHCGGAFLSREAFQNLCGQDNRTLAAFLEIFHFTK